MGIFARSLGLARVTPVVGGYVFMYPHSLSGSFSTISSDPWIARRDAQHEYMYCSNINITWDRMI